MKKIISLVLVFVLALSCAVVFSSCGNKKPIIGVLQFGSHESLNNCYDGIIEGLKEGGIDVDKYEIKIVNNNFDTSLAQTQANNLVNEGAEIIIAIATPSAVAAATAAKGTIPVVYCAVTDNTVMANYKSVTGVSDIPNFEKQLELVTAFMNKTDLKIGVLYSTDESSSPVQVSSLKDAAAKYTGMEISASAVSDITTIDAKVNELIANGVDCFINLLDNTIVGKLQTNILPITNEKGIPVFGSEIEQVKVGCVASASIEYISVGKLAGKQAAEILQGKKVEEIPAAIVSEPNNYYNGAACEKFSLTVPANITASEVSK